MTCTCAHPRAQHLELAGACIAAGCRCHKFTTAPGPPVTFDWLGRWSNKVTCSVCGSAGYPDSPWQDNHRAGHLPCTSGCGKLLSVTKTGKARAHGKWPCPAPGEVDPDA